MEVLCGVLVLFQAVGLTSFGFSILFFLSVNLKRRKVLISYKILDEVDTNMNGLGSKMIPSGSSTNTVGSTN
jgi:hypothetical protein